MDGEEGSEGWGEDEDGGAGCPTSDEAVTERMGTDMVVMKDAISLRISFLSFWFLPSVKYKATGAFPVFVVKTRCCVEFRWKNAPACRCQPSQRLSVKFTGSTVRKSGQT